MVQPFNANVVPVSKPPSPVGDIIVAVSYTHLDVYKRQQLMV